MSLLSLKLVNFRNFGELFIEASPGLNLLIGPNGSGKTSVLEALYFLCFSKSFRSNSDLDLLKKGKDYFQTKALFLHGDRKQELQGNVEKGRGKRFLLNGSPVQRLSDIVSTQAIVLQSPEDIRITLGGSKEKRLYFNRLLSQLHPEFLDRILDYNRVLKQRNAWLKTLKSRKRIEYDLQLETYDEQLQALYYEIYRVRREEIAAFQTVFQRYYDTFYGKSSVQIPEMRYLPSVEGGDAEEFHSRYMEKSRARSESEILLSRTLIGANYDKIHFLREGRSMEHSSSQGEHKLWMILMKLTEGEQLSNVYGSDVLFLFDDIFSELDVEKTQAVIEKVKDYPQVFISATDLSDIRRHGLDLDHRAVKVINFAENLVNYRDGQDQSPNTPDHRKTDGAGGLQ